MKKYILASMLLALSTSLFSYTCPDIGDLQIFPSDNFWNWDMTEFEKHPDSESIILAINVNAKYGFTNLHPDYGANEGIPYTFAGKEAVEIKLKQREQTDFGPMPIPLNAPVEGALDSKDLVSSQKLIRPLPGDRRVIVLDPKEKKLYELFDAAPQTNHWTAKSACIWDLTKNEMRKKGEGSCDNAGLAIFPGLVRYEEVAKGEIKHALRCTFSKTKNSYLFPATHKDSRLDDPNLPPMGMRLRLSKDFDVTGFSATNQVVLTALKKYGMIVADNGNSWYISGAPDSRWKDDDLRDLKKVLAVDFEVIKTTDKNGLTLYPKGIRPKIEYVSGKRGRK
ncbi:MAG: hypothetical protein V1752_01900 [Candidatus Firestonebacteria bacterium]